MTLSRIVLCVAAILVMVRSAGAQGVGNDTTLASLNNKRGLLAVVPWNAGGHDLLCVFAKKNQDSADRETSSIKTMTVYLKDGSTLKKLFEIQTGDWFLTAYPLQEDGRFLVGWGTGSAYHFQVYAYAPSGIKQVFDKGSRSSPEVLFDDAGDESLLFTEMEMVGGEWRSSAGMTTVFQWNGKGYEVIGTVPWAKRLQCLSKQSCAAVK